MKSYSVINILHGLMQSHISYSILFLGNFTIKKDLTETGDGNNGKYESISNTVNLYSWYTESKQVIRVLPDHQNLLRSQYSLKNLL